MVAPSVKEQLLEQIETLTPEQQQQVLDFMLSLQHSQLPPGTPGEVLLARMGTFQFEAGELEAMQQAIEEHCESALK